MPVEVAGDADAADVVDSWRSAGADLVIVGCLEAARHKGESDVSCRTMVQACISSVQR